MPLHIDTMMIPKIYPLSETAISIEWCDRIDENVSQKILQADQLLNKFPFGGFVETVPAYTTLTVFYRPELVVNETASPFEVVKKIVEKLLEEPQAAEIKESGLFNIPVCYDDEFGYDLEFIASTNGISKETVIDLHQKKEYRVYMMGFLPGFAYMGEVDDIIATTRKSSPRPIVEEGSVGIAGKQTGIYPLSSPGGWQIVGRTPLCLFDIQKEDPFLLKTGNRIKFYPISKQEFDKIIKEHDIKPFIKEDPGAADAVVIKPGVFSTIQDGGRLGYRVYGVPSGGVMDELAHSTANALAGNTKNAATIECTMGGLLIQFKKNAVIAVTGGGAAFINGKKIKLYQPLSLDKNDSLEIKYNNDGIRTYIAVRGGFSAENIMNSKSVCLRAGIGSAFKKEDGLRFDNEVAAEKRTGTNRSVPTYTTHASIRVIAGAENDWMTTESIQQFNSKNFILSNRCDRMGYHLQSDPLLLQISTELLSTAVTKGTIQLTPGGQLIVLMSDCQTTGGYPRVAQVAAVDLPVLAQLKPGDTIQFINIPHADAEKLYLLHQKKIDELFG